MKTFYTERDIVDMHQAGVAEIAVDDDVVLTDLARQKAMELGIDLRPVDRAGSPAAFSAPPLPAAKAEPLPEAELAARIKGRVIARLGTTEYNDLLDQVIPQVLARLTISRAATGNQQHPASLTTTDY